MSAPGFACFDVETTGLDPGRARVIEVAVVRISPTGAVTGEWTTLLNVGTRELGRIDIHGIHPEWLESAPTFTEIAGDLVAQFADHVPVAHNAPFDTRFLESEWKKLGYGEMGLDAIDTLEIARYAGLSGRLGLLAEELGVPLSHPHQALDDSRVLAAVMAVFLKRGCVKLDKQPFPRLLMPQPSGRVVLRPGGGQATTG